jgi:uncharacterized protein (DUF2147 family)
MKKTILSLILLAGFQLFSFAQVSQITGKWKTIDDNDGSTKSIVYIFKATNGKYYGKIEHLFKNPDKKCTECQGANKDKPILGMMVVNDMEEKNGKLTGGTILDPNNGKVYRCTISFDAATGNLNVRGSLDKTGIIGRTQTWIKN